MSESNKKTIYVGPGRESGADGVCSAVVLADLRNRLIAENKPLRMSPSYSGPADENTVYKAVRCADLDPETKFILDEFKVPAPPLMTDARTQVRDIDYSSAEPVDGDISLLEAWNIMNKVSKSTLAVCDGEGRLKGVITKGDIAKSYMAVFDNEILARANTPVKNIMETLEGTLVTGDIDGRVDTGKVLIAAANTDVLRKMTSPGDVVILGNRYEAQLSAIERQASVIIADHNAPITRTITRIATERGCTIIRTPYDAYGCARLINQSIPISHFMTEKPVSFYDDDYIDDIRETMTQRRFRDFPIVTRDGRYLGTISRRNLIDMDRKRFIMVDHNSQEQALPGIEEAEITEIIDHHRLETVETIRPLVIRERPVGSTAAIIAHMFRENAVEADPVSAGLLCCGIISATENFTSASCTPFDKRAAQEMAEIAGIDIASQARVSEEAAKDNE